MARVGRKPEKLIAAWAALRKHMVKPLMGHATVNRPLALLQQTGISYQHAVNLLIKLEKAGYIQKEFLGGVKLEYVLILKDVGELGEDILGAEDPVLPIQVQATVPARSTMQQPAPSASVHPTPPQMPLQAPAILTPAAAQTDVVIIVDWENVKIPLESIGAEFPAEKLLKFARGKGNVISALAFIPLTASRDARLFLRRNGYRIIECPPLKDGGGDTVDKTIEEFMRLLMLIPSVGTFILVSRDADFQDARRMVQAYGRQCISVCYDPLFNDVRSEEGEIIYSPLGRQAAVRNGNSAPSYAYHRNTRDANRFFYIIGGMETGKIGYDCNDNMHELIVRTLEVLGSRSRELEQVSTRKNFMALCESVWADVRRDFRDFSREDMKELLTAFNNRLVLRQNKYVEMTYYTFDDQCALVKRLMSLRVLRGM